VGLFEVAGGKLKRVEPASFVAEEIKERAEIQRWLRGDPTPLGENLFIITEEFGEWEDSRRRIDLLALDEDRNLVVIEIKRTEEGSHMDLQAVRYAAMVSSMSLEDVVRAHEAFMARQNIEGNARERFSEFLGTAIEAPVELTTVPRILLVSHDFSLEITTTVLWLVERGIDIKCLRLQPYRLGERVLIDVRQVLPLEEASEYQVRIRQKDESVRRSVSGKQRERTLYVLARHGLIQQGTEIELIPKALPVDAATHDKRTFRATIGDVNLRDSVVWALDGKPYSASHLTQVLWYDHGALKLRNNIFVHWRIAGDDRSMWDRAEELSRGEHIVDS
jgi:hypothetical protein